VERKEKKGCDKGGGRSKKKGERGRQNNRGALVKGETRGNRRGEKNQN